MLAEERVSEEMRGEKDEIKGKRYEELKIIGSEETGLVSCK